MILLKKYNIAYIPVPKNACTSIKLLLFELEFGRKFVPFENSFDPRDEGKRNKRTVANIHELRYLSPNLLWQHGTRQFNKNLKYNYDIFFCVVRNPIDRMLSCYKNRVIAQGALNKTIFQDKIKNINDFIINLNEICKISAEIQHHVEKQVYFLGEQSKIYTHIFNFHQLPKLVKLLQEKTTIKLNLPNEQKSWKDDEMFNLVSNRSKSILEQFYKEDYESFEKFF